MTGLLTLTGTVFVGLVAVMGVVIALRARLERSLSTETGQSPLNYVPVIEVTEKPEDTLRAA